MDCWTWPEMCLNGREVGGALNGGRQLFDIHIRPTMGVKIVTPRLMYFVYCGAARSTVLSGSCAVLFASEICRTTVFEASGFGW